jgi:multiple sugar transport system substrate-binding protein
MTACWERTGLTRRALVGGAAPVVGALAAACGDSPGSGAAGAPQGGLRSGTTVTFYQGGTQVDADGREEIFKAFQERYPQLTVQQVFNPADNGAKIQAAITAGTPPDVFYVGNGADVTTYAARGALQDLTPLAKRDKLDTSDFFEAALALYRLCGRQYAYPIDFPNQELYYNVDLFEQAGVKPPPGDWNDATWMFDRFVETAKRLARDPDNGPWAYFSGLGGFRNWYVWVTANGGDLFDKDLKTCTIADAPAVDALQLLQDLIHRHRVAASIQQGATIGGQGGGALNGFTGGRFAMATLPPWMGQVRQDMRQRWDVAPHPKGNGSAGRWACAGGGTGLALSSPSVGARNVNEAWELVKYCESKQPEEVYIKYVGIVPPLKSLVSSPAFAPPGQPPRSIKVFTDGATHLRPDPSIVRWTDIMRMVNPELNAVWAGQKTARAAADEIKRGVDPILKEIQTSGELACK